MIVDLKKTDQPKSRQVPHVTINTGAAQHLVSIPLLQSVAEGDCPIESIPFSPFVVRAIIGEWLRTTKAEVVSKTERCD